MQHAYRDENAMANIWHSKHQISNQIEKKWFSKKIGCCDFQSMHSATICYAKPSLAKSDGLISETRGSEVSRNSDESSEMMAADPDDWRTPLVRYLENLGHIHDRKVRWRALKYVMLDNTLYR
jgi:hypothetical protein